MRSERPRSRGGPRAGAEARRIAAEPAPRDAFPPERAIRHLIDLLAAPGPSGREGEVAALVRRKLAGAGIPERAMRHDRAHVRLGGGFTVGNLIVKLPGTTRGPLLLFSSHLDTVPLAQGAVPVRRGRRIVARGPTALGADDRTGVAALVTLAEALLRHGLPHPPLTLLFTVGEEVGLRGSSAVRAEDLGRPRFGFNVDSGDPRRLITGAVGTDHWTAEITGVAAHAGVHPERGVSALLVAARAVASAAQAGWFGRVEKGGVRGTSNIGRIEGGRARNEVASSARVEGESRSHRQQAIAKITQAYRRAFERAARTTRNAAGDAARVRFDAVRRYEPFKLRAREPVVRLAERAVRAIGLEPERAVADGGLDANQLNRKGIPTVTAGAGQHGAHTLREYVEIAEYLDGCRLLLAVVREALRQGD